MEEFTYIFLPLEIKVSFFKPPKCIFSQLISWNRTFEVTLSVNFWSLWQTKYVTMWGWEISTWRTEHSNYLPKSHYGCNLRCIWLYVLLQKYPRVEFSKDPCCKCSKQMISTEMDAEHSLYSFLAERWKLLCLLE